MVELQGLDAGYSEAVLRGIDFTAGKGELAALLGANGSGKTVLLKTIAGLLKPLAGRVLVDGKDVSSLKNAERAGKISFLSQKNSAEWPFTVKEIVAQGFFHTFHKQGKNEKEIADALAVTDLTDFAEKPITELSGGEFQRVLIARAVAQKADILLLDEPISGLDPKFALSMMKLIKKLTVEQGITVLMSLHDINLASLYADRAVFIAQKKLTIVRPDELSQDYFYTAL